MNQRIDHCLYQAGLTAQGCWEDLDTYTQEGIEKFAELIVRECIDKIETHQIPVGNSAAGEMACEWTYDALKEISDEIREHFGVEE
jgi:hypothetical protein